MKVKVLRNIGKALQAGIGLESGELEGQTIECATSAGETLCKMGLAEIIEAPKPKAAPAPAVSEAIPPALKGGK